MRDTRKLIEIMQHFVDGGRIEVSVGKVNMKTDTVVWEECRSPTWNWLTHNYRILKEKK